MTHGELIVLAVFGVGLLCSLTLLVWFVRTLRREGKPRQ